MFIRPHVIPGEAPGSLGHSNDFPEEPPVITLIEYGPDSFEERRNVGCEELLVHLDNELVTWINIDGFGDLTVLRTLGERFNLHPLALEDVLDITQRPKVEQYDDYLFIVAKMIYFDGNKDIGAEQVSMFLGKTFLITLQEEAEFDVFEPVRARIRSGKDGSAQPRRIIWLTLCSTRLSITTIRCWSQLVQRSMRSRTAWWMTR